MQSMPLRLLKRVGARGLWKRVGRVHGWLYRVTGGVVGHSAGHITNLLLTTTGRKSGVERTVPLTYLRDGADYVLVASNGGADTHPAWWLNLQHTASARIQVGRQTVEVTARLADPLERSRLWPLLTRYNPFYANYERITRREIPVVILTPAE